MRDVLFGIVGEPTPYELHQLVYERFAADGTRDFLFTPVDLDGSMAVLVRGDFDKGRDPYLPVQGETVAFQLLASPTVKRNGKRGAIARHKNDLRQRWIERRGQDLGFEVISCDIRSNQLWIDRGGKPFWIEAAAYVGTLKVTDADAFHHAMRTGIGGRYAWGLGLLIVKPLQ